MGARQFESLTYAVRGRVILKHMGSLLAILGLMLLPVMAVALIYREHGPLVGYGVAALACIVVGLAMSRIRAPSNLLPSEALVVSALIFSVSSLILAFPMSRSGLSPLDAFFESVSAITTTGLSCLPTVEMMDASFLFARAWIQWIGGLGIIVLSIALLMRPGNAAKRLLDWEETEDIVGGARVFARKVLMVYLLLTAIGVLAVVLSGAGVFPAVIHALAAVSTGGFSGFDESIAGFVGRAPRIVLTVLSLLGAISLPFYLQTFRGKRMAGTGRHIEFVALLIAGSVTTLLLSLAMESGGDVPWSEIVLNAPFLALSAQTTTGFSTMSVQDLNSTAKLILVLSMLVGGSVGSTAGGIKLIRVVIFFRMLKMTVVRASLPRHAVAEPALSGHRLDREEIEGSLLLIVLFVVVVVGSWIPFVSLGYDPLGSLFEVVSATCTVGLSAGLVEPSLPPLLKAVLCADMLMGRLEIVAFLVLLYPGTWLGRRAESS